MNQDELNGLMARIMVGDVLRLADARVVTQAEATALIVLELERRGFTNDDPAFVMRMVDVLVGE